MNDSVQSPYQTPKADLIEVKHDGQAFPFERFTAWGVFGLSVITLGIYPIYWLYSRSNIANEVSPTKIEKFWLVALLVSTALSFVAGLFSETGVALFANVAIQIAYIVAYVVVAFKLKSILSGIMSQGSSEIYQLSGLLTFFFSAIYFQYKINEYLDNSQTKIKV